MVVAICVFSWLAFRRGRMAMAATSPQAPLKPN
jgi:hypothetical protein